jgi:hypothetical protein
LEDVESDPMSTNCPPTKILPLFGTWILGGVSGSTTFAILFVELVSLRNNEDTL